MDAWTTARGRGVTSLLLAILGSLAAASPGAGQISPRCSDGEIRQLRVTLTPMEGEIVRQLQERSEDGGVTWSAIFDGRYHPVETTGR